MSAVTTKTYSTQIPNNLVYTFLPANLRALYNEKCTAVHSSVRGIQAVSVAESQLKLFHHIQKTVWINLHQCGTKKKTTINYLYFICNT